MARVLVVEDDGATRRTLQETLAGLGHEPSGCADGQEALERLQREHYDLVITDLVMPRMDGLELTERLRWESPATPVLLVTGHDSLDLMARAVNRGIADYLRKPLRLTILDDSVRRTLERRGFPAPARPARRPAGGLLQALVGVVAALLLLLCLYRLWGQVQRIQGLDARLDRVENVR